MIFKDLKTIFLHKIHLAFFYKFLLISHYRITNLYQNK